MKAISELPARGVPMLPAVGACRHSRQGSLLQIPSSGGKLDASKNLANLLPFCFHCDGWIGDDSMRRQAGFFDVVDRLKRLSDLGEQLEAFEAAVEFEAFRPELNAALTYSDGTQRRTPAI